MRELLKDEIRKTLDAPLRWQGEAPIDDETFTAAVNEFSQAITGRLFEPIRDSLSVHPQRSWQEAYSLAGRGSTFVRARRIADEVFAGYVPVPGASPSPDQNNFLHLVVETIEAAAEEVGVELT